MQLSSYSSSSFTLKARVTYRNAERTPPLCAAGRTLSASSAHSTTTQSLPVSANFQCCCLGSPFTLLKCETLLTAHRKVRKFSNGSVYLRRNCSEKSRFDLSKNVQLCYLEAPTFKVWNFVDCLNRISLFPCCISGYRNSPLSWGPTFESSISFLLFHGQDFLCSKDQPWIKSSQVF